MRIAFFSEAVPPLLDGACHALSNLWASLEREGVEYRVFSGVEPGIPFRDIVERVPSVPFPLYRYYRMSLPVVPILDAALDRYQPDLIHAANPTPIGLYTVTYGKRRNVPVVASYHTNYVAYFPYYGLGGLSWLGWSILRWFHSRCRATYAPSLSAMRELTSRGVPRVDLWQRGVHLDQFHPRFRSDDLRATIGAKKLPVLLYVGRLVKEKDLAVLAKAAMILARRGFRFRLVIVGDGPLRRDLEARMPEAHFTGTVTGIDLARWYASADGFVFPSTTETFGNVILESFASGLPVVGADAGGTRDLVEPGRNGLLARPKDPEDLADRIQTLLSDSSLRMTLGAGGLQTARRFDWSAVNARLITSYERVIRDHRGPAPVPELELATG